MGDVLKFPRAKRQGQMRSVRVAVPFTPLEFDLGATLRGRAQVDHLLAGENSSVIDEAHRLRLNAPTLAQLRRWQATTGRCNHYRSVPPGTASAR